MFYDNIYNIILKEELTLIEELKTLIAVVENGSFTKAAEQRNLSQPSISIHIKNLEEYFGVNLIKRSNKQKNIYITENGYLLYKRAKEIIKIINITKSDLLNLSDTIKGSLKIGASLTIGEYLLPLFLKYFTNKYPEVEIEIVIGNTLDICEDVRNIKLDLGLIEGIAPSFEFKQGYFSEDTMVLMVPFNDSLLEEIDFEKKLHNERWICREEGSGTREYLNMFLANREIKPKSIMVLGSNNLVKEAVKNNLGITLISSHVAEESEKYNEVSIIKLEEEYKRHFSYILPKDMIVTKLTEIFIKEIIEFHKDK